MNYKLFFLFKNVLRFKLLYICWFLIFIGICILYFSSNKDNSQALSINSSHVLCVIVPFRNRFEELLQYVPHMSKFLNQQGIRFYISVINQIDHYRFNRGSLINAGFLIITEKHPDCDYIAMHDVDLLPLNSEISYKFPADGAFHVSSPELHPMYHYKTFIGGILLISNTKFTLVNGLSNKFWGWGKEDDEFYLRLKEKLVKIYRPSQTTTNQTNTFRHIHGPSRKRDYKRCANQAQRSHRRDRITGLNSVNYVLSSAHLLTIDEFPFSMYNVNLTCDREFTPWCVCS